MIKNDLVRKIRRLQQFVSLLLFLIVFTICWKVTNFNLTEIQLSEWGESGWFAPLWNGAICILAGSILITQILYIKHNRRIKRKKIPYILFSFVSLSLLLVGIFNSNYPVTHHIAAYTYFFSYPLVIFITTYLNRNTLQYKEWINHNLISIGMMVSPLTFMYLFDGFAIAEIAHIFFVTIWNLKLLFKK